MSNQSNGFVYLSSITESKLLAMIYMNQQNLKDLAPEELAEKYRNTQIAISEKLKK